MSRVEVSRTINATPERMYELISDLPRMGRWSPENAGGNWQMGATGPAVGGKFNADLLGCLVLPYLDTRDILRPGNDSF